MVDTVPVRGLLRYLAGTVVLSHNASFSLWRRSAAPDDLLAADLREDRLFLDDATADIVAHCHDIGCGMPRDFFGLSNLSSIIVASFSEEQAVRGRFENDHRQMVDDAQFLLTVSPFESLPRSATFLVDQSSAHDQWAFRWSGNPSASRHLEHHRAPQPRRTSVSVPARSRQRRSISAL